MVNMFNDAYFGQFLYYGEPETIIKSIGSRKG